MATKDAFTAHLGQMRQVELQELAKKRLKAQSTANVDADSSSLYEIVAPHVESFNWIFEGGQGLQKCVANLPTALIDTKADETMGVQYPKLELKISNVTVDKPSMTTERGESRMFPHQARELGLTYDAPLSITLERRLNDGPWETLVRPSGRLPIMVRSNRCHLEGLSRADMVKAKEEAGEWGGYFIINGNERLVRLLVMPRRNHIFALERPSFTNRGPEYTRYAASIRCVRSDQSAHTINVHYLNNGSVTVRLIIRKQEFFIPAVLLLRALTGMTDRTIYERLTLNDPADSFIAERAELMIRESKALRLRSRKEVLQYLGRHFRLPMRVDRGVGDEEAGIRLLDDNVFIHIQDFVGDGMAEAARNNAINSAKAELLLSMMHRVLLLAQGTIKPDNADALSAHECLLPGYLFASILKESLHDWLMGVRGAVLSDMRRSLTKCKPSDVNYWRKLTDSVPEVGRKLKYFVTTGNLVSKTGLDLMQVAGFTIVAEKLNYYRYLSHFRSIHRGQFFTTMKTTSPRKLLPESWGFLCPVHTPDGSPCGLLNHLTSECRILASEPKVPTRELVHELFALGMTDPRAPPSSALIPVLLDGVLVGRVLASESHAFAARLRYLKVTGFPVVDKHTEIFCIPDLKDGLYPCVVIATTPSRFQRPIYYLPTTAVKQPLVEYIGPLEQLTMDIACTSEDFQPGVTTHQEIKPTNILSVIASLTPFSDHNQSPRNMYQCQMGKQTMGTPFHSFPYRVDNKVYRIQNPQIPIVRNESPQQKFLFDEYPMGCNAIVAVISYTGYDMEDACIINKFAYERGFGHGSVYKYKTIDLKDYRVSGEGVHHRFSNATINRVDDAGHKQATLYSNRLEADGLPYAGQLVHPDQPLAMVHNDVTQTFKPEKFKDTEPAYVEEIRVLGGSEDGVLQKVGMKLRMNRNPVIGDKFSSRHGQKGVLSVLFPHQDMPWTESGMTPDVIINPHAFPSRMTIGMLIESMAGKAGALHGRFQDGTPFQFNEKNRAVDYFGQQLRDAGYNYLGTEPLYSGVSGEPLMADIFFGVVFYQRLRHMVKDKFQARATGPVNSLHRQPIKGRKKHGGIRFGEMERDSLIAHGVSFMLHDRLMNSSDYHTTYVCETCGSLLAAHAVPMYPQHMDLDNGTTSASVSGTKTSKSVSGTTKKQDPADKTVMCRLCKTGSGCSVIAIPFVFLYLVNELAAMNIRLTLDVKACS